MIFTELEKEEFTKFLNTHPLRTFFQTTEMEEISKMGGWTSYYVGVKEDGKVIAASRIVSRPTRLGKKIFYAPRGVLVDYKNKELLTFFINHIKDFVKEKGGYTFHIDPPLIYKERDINGDLVEGGIDNSDAIKNLIELGFEHEGFTRHYDVNKQVRWSFELPLTGKTKEDVLKEMSGNTRRAIQKAEHLKVRVREIKKEELPIFKEITEKTSERRGFKDKTMEYYELMYDLFHPKKEIKFMVAEVFLDDSIGVLQDDYKALEQDYERSKEHHKEGKMKEDKSQMDALQKRIEELKKLKEEKGNHLYVACSMLCFMEEIFYIAMLEIYQNILPFLVNI